VPTNRRITTMTDTFNLQRFTGAQAEVWPDVVRELGNGLKESHWMWFVFPQLTGLGRSATAERFALSGRAEAKAYAQHPLLMRRLRECCKLINQLGTNNPEDIFGPTDAMKLHSSLTLFIAVAGDNGLFLASLNKLFAGVQDRKTLQLLNGQQS
jgi:uncharacterized protein (DUF1810 family)